ncbi:MAG: ribosome small subunit-dependent GTPase A [Gemmatimonadetes bacterium]|nr:MAG: ribosome small subunit-dependent GTPase A [Gemmatimonadota bacterium]
MSGALAGMVHMVRGGVYTVVTDDGTLVEASLRGRLKQQTREGDQVVIGDRVHLGLQEGGAYTIEAVEPRRTRIARTRGGGHRPRVLVANADRLLAVMAGADPSPRQEVLDRLLVAGEAGGVEPVVVLNKVDLPGGREVADRLAAVYGKVGYRVVEASALTREGLDDLRAVVCDGLSAMAGPSGVGKSSLANALEPALELRTGELSRKLGRGRHTTVTSRLIRLSCGGLLADTPGFSDVGLWGVPPDELDLYFPEMRALREACRFRGCTHLHEPGCAVRDALDAGEIDPGRYRSYRTLFEG